MIVPPLAVHLSDGVILWPWLTLGFAAALPLLAWSARGIDDDEIPRIGLLTAAFFVASYIRVPAGPTSVHLLFNGLVGVMLGRRAVLAVAVGLFLQKMLFDHGGYSTLGLNVCVIAFPALLARPIYAQLAAPARPSFRCRDGLLAVTYILYPLLTLPLALICLIAYRKNWPSSDGKELRAGFAVGLLGVLLTALLNATILVAGGVENWRIVALFVLAAHVPIALVEGVITAGAVAYLQRVKPAILRI